MLFFLIFVTRFNFLVVSYDNVCISKVNFQKGEQNFNNIINEYTKLDPTLPRINNMICPNASCPSNEKKMGDGEEKSNYKYPEIIYLRFDNNAFKLIVIFVRSNSITYAS